jgi:L-fucose isomerase-like protein
MRPIDVKVNVKPVFAQLVHSGPYEGPCRVGREEDLAPEAERQKGRAQFKEYARDLRENLGRHAQLLEPIYMEWGDDFVLPEAELAKLEPDVRDAYPAVAIAHRYGKPVGMMGWVASVDITAYLRSRGLEGYALCDYEHLKRVLSLLKVRKAFRRTRILVAGDGNTRVPTGVVSSIWDLEGLKRRYGVDYACISAMDLIRAMDGLGEAERGQAEELTNRLIENAEDVHMSREDVLRSVEFYLAAKKALDRYECNAFVIPCFEICVKQVLEERRVTFCLTHSLLKDQGIPSACEADTNVLMAIALLMYLSGKSVYMGNSYLVDRDENILAVHHDVPGLKMKGLDEPDLPYEIRNFTIGGWGATIRYDFSRDIGAPVTLARFDPTGTRVLVVKGKVAGSSGIDQVGCALSAHIQVRDIVDLFHKEMDFGHHLAVVYGDYVQDVKELGEIMGFQVVEA